MTWCVEIDENDDGEISTPRSRAQQIVKDHFPRMGRERREKLIADIEEAINSYAFDFE